jgi:hypothetical protein
MMAKEGVPAVALVENRVMTRYGPLMVRGKKQNEPRKLKMASVGLFEACVV